MTPRMPVVKSGDEWQKRQKPQIRWDIIPAFSVHPSPPSFRTLVHKSEQQAFSTSLIVSLIAEITMSAQRSRQRLPISCEPCRVRKIRCPRDTPPCGTCVRRRVPPDQCVYRTRKLPQISSQRQLQQAHPPSQPPGNDLTSLDTHVQPSCHDPAREPNAALVSRIEKLEQLLHAKNQLQETALPPPSAPYLDPELVERRRPEEPATALATGTLIPSTSGHVRFLPVTSGWRIVHRAAQESSLLNPESTVTDTPSGSYPFGEHDTENRPNLLAKLPPAQYCDQLKDVYFQSFAPVSFLSPDIIRMAKSLP